MVMTIPSQDPLAAAATEAVQKGDLETLRQLLAENPGLVNARIGNGMSRTLLHAATDWPGHFPNGVAIVTALVEAGAMSTLGSVVRTLRLHCIGPPAATMSMCSTH